VRPEAKLADFTHHEKQVTTAERDQLCSRLSGACVETIQGRAKFVDPHTLSISQPDGSERQISAEKILIATGSSPLRPPEFHFEHPRIHDSNEILDIIELPAKLAVIGAGVIGAEYASTFAALGVEVHVIDGRAELFPFVDDDVAASLYRAMCDAGIHFHWNERVTKCDIAGPADIRLGLTSGAELQATDVLVAAGRSSNTAGLNLEAAGLKTGDRGLLIVNRHYRTDVEHIYAAGDVVGPPALAGTSMEQARVAVCHAFDIINKQTSRLLPTGIYTIPEISMIGETEQQLKEKKIEYISGVAHYSQNARGRIIGDESGLLKLLFAREDMRLLGVHVIGEQATELVHIGLVAMHCGCTAEFFSYACFNYPTLGDLYKYAAYDAMAKRPPHSFGGTITTQPHP
jgi:NAD(P) transhydrogenase